MQFTHTLVLEHDRWNIADGESFFFELSWYWIPDILKVSAQTIKMIKKIYIKYQLPVTMFKQLCFMNYSRYNALCYQGKSITF